MSESAESQLDAVFQALADSKRRLILDELSKRDEQPLFELCVRLVEGHGMALSRQAISKHLAVLESAGLIRTSWQGRTKLHSSRLSEQTPTLINWLNQRTHKASKG